VPTERRRSRFGAAGRLALFPARAAARASKGPLEAAAEEHLVPEFSRIADRALAGSLPEDLARSLVEHHVLERMAAEMAESGALDEIVAKALASPHTQELTDRIVRSEEVRRAIREVVASPEVRAAMTEQSKGFFDELADDLRRSGVEVDDRIEGAVRRHRRFGATAFAGLATRAVAFGIDLLAIAVILAVLAGFTGFVSYLVGGLHPKWLVGTLVGGGAIVVAALYLILFWSLPGRTPGMYLMGLRVRRGERPPSVVRACVRAVVTWISIVPFFLGYVTVLFDERRRGLPDLVAGTEVVYDER